MKDYLYGYKYLNRARKTAFALLASACLLSQPIGVVQADQNDPTLSILFDNLRELKDPGDINRITSEIWSRWSTHPTNEALTKRLNRGVIMMNQGDYVHAEALFSDIIDDDPLFSEAWNKRATLYFITGNLQKSRADIAQTLAVEPRHFGALAGLGLVELHLGNDEAALRAYQAAIEINPHMKDVIEIIDNLQEKLQGLAL